LADPSSRPASNDVPGPGADPSATGRRAHDILGRAEFRRPGPNIFERVQRWFTDWIGRFFNALAGAAGGGLVGWLILIAAVGVIVWFTIRRVRRGSWRSVRPRGPLDAAAVSDASVSPQEWAALAIEHERAGRWRDALRCEYRALLITLAERGGVELVPGETTGEERVALGRLGDPVSAPFDEFVELFERCWYGGAPASQLDLARARTLAHTVVDAVAASTAPSRPRVEVTM